MRREYATIDHVWAATEFRHFELPGEGATKMGRGRQPDPDARTEITTGSHKEMGRLKHGNVEISHLCVNRVTETSITAVSMRVRY